MWLHEERYLRTHEWSDAVEGSEIVISTAVAGTKTNDILFLPGVYKIVGSWTADEDSYSDWEGSISIEAGKRSNLSISLWVVSRRSGPGSLGSMRNIS